MAAGEARIRINLFHQPVSEEDRPPHETSPFALPRPGMPGRRRPPSRHGALLLATGLLLGAATAQAATGKLLLTGGVSTVEGAAGGGISPWALIGTQATEGEIGGSAFASRVSDTGLRRSTSQAPRWPGTTAWKSPSPTKTWTPASPAAPWACRGCACARTSSAPSCAWPATPC